MRFSQLFADILSYSRFTCVNDDISGCFSLFVNKLILILIC